MKVVRRLDVDEAGVRVLVREGELLLLNNALNEVCNGGAIEDWEFSRRLGVGQPPAASGVAVTVAARPAPTALSAVMEKV